MNIYLRIITIYVLTLMACNESEQIDYSDSNKKRVLLIGVAHFNQLGIGGIHPIDIFSIENQNVLNQIAQNIKNFNPSKVFVEMDIKDQKFLDSLYLRHLGKQEIHDSRFLNNEIYQLGFRIGETSQLNSITAIDEGQSMFPIDSILMCLDSFQKVNLEIEIEDFKSDFITGLNECIAKEGSVKSILKYMNSENSKTKDLAVVNSFLAYACSNNEITINTVSNHYKKHLKMWSRIIRKMENETNQNIVIIFGASHTAILEKIIQMDGNYRIEPLNNYIN